MAGVLAPLRVIGDLAPLLPLLTLGATGHAGSEAALGLGRYALGLW